MENLLKTLEYKSNEAYRLLQELGVINYRKEHYKKEWSNNFEEYYNDIVHRIGLLQKELKELEEKIISFENKPTDKISRSDAYCYDSVNGICPYFYVDPFALTQENGVCLYLGERDETSEGIPLLWDQIKCCDF